MHMHRHIHIAISFVLEPETRNVGLFLIEDGPWINSSLPTFLHGLSLWPASVRGDMANLQGIIYELVFLSMASVDQPSVVITVMLYSFSSGGPSTSLSGLLEFSSVEELPDAPGHAHPLFLPAIDIPIIPSSSQTICSGRQKTVLRYCCFQMDQRDHLTKGTGYEEGLKTCSWDFGSLI